MFFFNLKLPTVLLAVVYLKIRIAKTLMGHQIAMVHKEFWQSVF